MTVRDDASTTQHRVRIPEEYAQRIAPDVDKSALLEASFRFLLAQESKESILEEFELPMIERYFSDFPDRIQDHL